MGNALPSSNEDNVGIKPASPPHSVPLQPPSPRVPKTTPKSPPLSSELRAPSNYKLRPDRALLAPPSASPVISSQPSTSSDSSAPIAKTASPEKPHADAQQQARLEAEQKARVAAEEKARLAAEEKARLEAEEKARLEAEKARLAAEEKARLEAEEKARLAAEEKARLEAEEKARLAAEEKARLEAEEKARLAAEEKARLEAEEKARLAAEEKARLEAEEKARLAAEEKARLAAEEKARLEAEEKARLAAEEKARLEAEEKARLEAEEKARLEAEEKARLEAEEKARLAAEEKARLEAEEKARLEAEEKARLEAEEKARLAAEVPQDSSDLFAALSNLDTVASLEESQEDMLAALSALDGVNIEQTITEESPEDMLAALSALDDASLSTSTTVGESQEDMLAALAALDDFQKSTTTEESQEDVLAALLGAAELHSPTTTPAEETHTTAKPESDPHVSPDEQNSQLLEALASLDAFPDSNAQVDDDTSVPDADALLASLTGLNQTEADQQPETAAQTGEIEETFSLPILSKKPSAASKASRMRFGRNIFINWEEEGLQDAATPPATASASDGGSIESSAEGISRPCPPPEEEFAEALLKRAENKGKKKVDVSAIRIGRSGARAGRTKKKITKEVAPVTQFAPMTGMEDTAFVVSPTAPPIMKTASKKQPAPMNPSWMSALFGGPDLTEPSPSEEPPVAIESLLALAPNSLLRDWCVREDINKPGLRRSKKRPIKGNKHGKKPLQMEDFNFCSFPWLGDLKQAMFCVFDGHVDKDCGQALVTAWPSVWKKLTGHLDFQVTTDLTQPLHDGFLMVDEELKEHEYCGSTMTVVILWEGPDGQRFVQSANVGDSLAFLIRDGHSIDLSEVHCARVHSEQERLRLAGAVINDGASRINGLSVTRAIGDHFVKEVVPGFTAAPFVSPPYVISEHDSHLILASDGLWDVLTGQEAFDLVAHEPSASRIATVLLQTALKSKKCNDNVTVCSIIL